MVNIANTLRMADAFKDITWVSGEAEAETLRDNSPSTDRRHSSSASNSTLTTCDSSDSSAARGRRSRPSVASASSKLPTVREKEQRAQSLGQSSDGSQQPLEEAVVSSKKVLNWHTLQLLPFNHSSVSLGLNKLQQGCSPQCGKRTSTTGTTRSVQPRKRSSTCNLQ